MAARHSTSARCADESIRVCVVNRGRKYLYMRYVDPVTGKVIERSTGETKKAAAVKAAGAWEAELREGRYKSPSKMTTSAPGSSSGSTSSVCLSSVCWPFMFTHPGEASRTSTLLAVTTQPQIGSGNSHQPWQRVVCPIPQMASRGPHRGHSP